MTAFTKKTTVSLFLFVLLFFSHQFSPDFGLGAQTAISPAITWHTYLGSSEFDICQAVAVDKQGNVCLIGNSAAKWRNPISPYAGDQDVFVAKLNKNGELLWNSFLGSKGWDEGRGITVDKSGNIYVVGSSARTWGAPVHRHNGDTQDAFAAKLDSKGELKWHTFMGGGNSGDRGMAIAVDANGNVHVGGFGGAFWDTQPVYPVSSGTDGWLAKLNSAGVRQWYTPMGSSKMASIRAVALDMTGNIYVAGWAEGPWFTSPVMPYSDKEDAFAAKLDSRGVQQWHSFLGSKGDDTGMGIALDGKGNILVSGSSDKTWGDPVAPLMGDGDAFVAKLNSRGALIWNTFAGSKREHGLGWAVATDSFGNIYSTGRAPLVKFNHDGVPLWRVTMMQLIGEGNSIAVDPGGNVFVACRGGDVLWEEPPVRPYSEEEDGMAVKIDRGLRIVSWNLMNYSGGNKDSRDEEFRKIISLMEPDILVVQEMESAKAVKNFLRNVMNRSSDRKYLSAKFHNGPDSDNALFYDKSRLNLQSQMQIPTSFRDISEFSLKIKSGPAEGSELKVYSTQFTEGKDSNHKKQREDQANTLRDYLNGLLPESDFLVCGSLNMTSSKEKAYKILTKSQSSSPGGNNGRLTDLIGTKGKWSDKAKFKSVHTESTRKIESESGAGGGLDDRYDMILLSNAMAQNKQLAYMPGSLIVLGNDGKHLNKAVNDPEHKIFSQEIADAFIRASDHLPVIIDLISLEKRQK